MLFRSDVPLRISLYGTPTDELIVVIVAHHINADGWSVGPLTRDLLTAYASRLDGNAPTVDPLAVQYADYTRWQLDVLGDETDPESPVSRQIGFWRNALDGAPDELSLPYDGVRPAVPTYRGASVRTVVDIDMHRAVGVFATARGVTTFMVLHAALAVVLSRISGSGDIVIGDRKSVV